MFINYKFVIDMFYIEDMTKMDITERVIYILFIFLLELVFLKSAHFMIGSMCI